MNRFWWERTKHVCLRAWQWEPLRRALVLYLAARIVLTLWAALVLRLVPADTGPALERPYFGIAPLNEGLPGLLLGPWQRFDTLHYTALALDGYQPNSSHTVFPPLYPLLIRVVGGLLGGRYLLAALLVSNLCAIGYFTVFFALAAQETGLASARKGLVYAALYPWSFFLLAGYSEPLFLLLAGLAFLSARRGRGWVAGLCGALAALTRLQGWTLAVPLLFEALRARKFRLLPLRMDLVWPLLPVAGSACFLIGRAWAGIEPISVTYATHWHQALAFPWVGLAANLRNMLSGTAHATDHLDFLAAWLFVGLTVLGWWRLRPIYALYMTVAMLFNLSYLRAPHPLSGMGRHTMELFPAFFLLAGFGERSPWLNRLILYPSVSLFLYLSAQFVLWGWVG